MIVGEAELSKIIHIEHKHNSYMIDDKRYSVKIKTRIITEKSKRKKEVGRSILGKTIWTIFGIAGTALAFKFFVLKD